MNVCCLYTFTYGDWQAACGKQPSTKRAGVKADEAALAIRQAIRQGVLQPGEDLIQEQVADRLGISRIPLREALQSLAALGIVTTSQGRGFRVAKLDADEVDELYGLRLRIEPAIAAEVVAAIRPAQIDRLHELDLSMRAAVKPEDWAQLNHLFHMELYKPAGAVHTLRFIRQLLDLVTPYSNVYVHGMGGRVRAEGEHAEMVAAIEAGDVDALERQIQLHLRGAQEAILRHLKVSTESDLVSRLVGLNE
jgi:DNA-binding GntR family transcriptional regulator